MLRSNARLRDIYSRNGLDGLTRRPRNVDPTYIGSNMHTYLNYNY